MMEYELALEDTSLGLGMAGDGRYVVLRTHTMTLLACLEPSTVNLQ